MFWFHPIQNQFIFRVRACTDAHLSMSTSLFEELDFEIAIGMDGNSKTKIQNFGETFVDTVEESTPGILDCYRDRFFWVRWDSTEIQFGLGSNFENQVLKSKLHNTQSIKALSLSSLQRQSIEFNFDKRQSEAFCIFPPLAFIISSNFWYCVLSVSRSQVTTEVGADYNTYWMTVFDRHHITFAVRACSDARILLTKRPGIREPKSTEIIIGHNSNKEVIIREFGSQELLESVDSPDILKCSEFRHFWLSWEHDGYSLGRGVTVGVSKVIEYAALHEFMVNGISFDSAERGVKWKFNDFKGEEEHQPASSHYFNID